MAEQNPQPSERASAHVADPPNFSLSGGLLSPLIVNIPLQSNNPAVLRGESILAIALVAWLPLLVISAVEGRAFVGSVAVPFIQDIEAHVRFLVALPLLLIAEFSADLGMRPFLKQFIERGLIPAESMGKFNAAIASTSRLRDSKWVDLLILAFVYSVGILIIWRQYVALDAPAWYSTPSEAGTTLSLAGMWYGYVSLPIFQFVLCRWYFRLYLWARLLKQISKIELNLVPGHPDRFGGLSFLPRAVKYFAVLAMAHGALLAGYLATRVLMLGHLLLDYKVEIALMVVFVLCIILVPLLVFVRQLAQARRIGLQQYGLLATEYVAAFHNKWVTGRSVTDETLLGTPDIQSQADLANTYNVVQSFRSIPFSKETVVVLALATLVPVTPLLLTIMPLEDLLKKLISILFK